MHAIRRFVSYRPGCGPRRSTPAIVLTATAVAALAAASLPALPSASFAALWTASIPALGTASLSAQTMPTDFRDEFLGHFERSSYKITELARVMPQELYAWSPGEGIMEVGEVYMHLARYNFMYLDENLGIAPPDGLDYSDIESIRDKARVQELFARSVEHVRDHATRMSEADLLAETRLYGRDVEGWAVLFQLLSHMNEHVGQSVAYARMNGIAPPWSR